MSRLTVMTCLINNVGSTNLGSTKRQRQQLSRFLGRPKDVPGKQEQFRPPLFLRLGPFCLLTLLLLCEHFGSPWGRAESRGSYVVASWQPFLAPISFDIWSDPGGGRKDSGGL